MRGVLLSTVVFSILVAGCAEDARPMNVAAPVSEQKVEVLPDDRPVSATVTWHEDLQRTQKLISDDSFVITNSWEPRDADLTYHGVQPVWDEWGRAVDAHVFRYPVMELEVTSIEFVGDFTGVKITAQWEAGSAEYAFDATDGRFMGYADLKHQLRSFADPRWREPMGGGYEASILIGMAYQALGGDLTRGIETWTGNITLTETDFSPLDGDCQAYEYGFEPAPWYREWMERQGSPAPETVSEAEKHRYAVCLEDDGNPLWSYSGNTTDHLALTRVSPAFALPALEGSPLPPVAFERQPLEPLELLLGLSGPIDVPPSDYPGDWADIVRPVIQGLGTNLDYIQYSMDAEQEYLNFLVKGWPPLPFPGIPLLPQELLAWDEHSWVWSADGGRAFWGTVDSRYGTPEEPDIHLSQHGSILEDYPTSRHDQVAAGTVQHAWGPLIAEENRMLHYYSFPEIMGDQPREVLEYVAPLLNTWYSFEHCFENIEGGRFSDFSFLTGQMIALGGQDSYWTGTGGGCSAGVASSSSSSGSGEAPLIRIPSAAGDLLLRPAQDGAPGVVLIPRTASHGSLVPRYDVIVLPDPMQTGGPVATVMQPGEPASETESVPTGPGTGAIVGPST